MNNLDQKNRLYKKGLWLEYFTVGYNIVEGFVSIGSGIIAGSVALISFGLDSFIESISGGVLIWRLKYNLEDKKRKKKLSERLLNMWLILFSFLPFMWRMKQLKNFTLMKCLKVH